VSMTNNRTAWLAPASWVLIAGVLTWVACSSSPVAPVMPSPAPTPIAQASPTPAPTPTPTPTPSASPSGDPTLGAPNPSATPDSCPVLTSWYSAIHNITDANQQPTKLPRVDGHVVVDSTPLFSGRACNAEHNFCGGRQCEDPRGGDWTLLEGGSDWELRADGYQIRIGPLKLGHHKWRVCPHFDAQDALGEYVPQAPDACTTGEFDVVPVDF